MEAKMEKIAEALRVAIDGKAPFLNVKASDNLCSSVSIHGSKQKKEEWLYNIFHNSPYFIFQILPPTRYYTEGDKLTVELISKGQGVDKFRRYTGTPDKVIAKVAEWIK